MKIQALWGVELRLLLNTKQLPPINPNDNNHVLDKPHIFLDEIMRQAQESEIIRLSMHVREGKNLATFEASNKQVKIITPFEIVDGMYNWADQILVASNEKKIIINNTIRKLKGFGIEPAIGDKIISLSNHWEDVSDQGEWALVNGLIGTITDYNIKAVSVPESISRYPVAYINTSFSLSDGDTFTNVPMDYRYLKYGEPALTPEQIYRMNKSNICPDAPYDFTYAYAITTHKAQGSEWDKVLAFEEKFPFDKETHMRHLYTTVTRAKEKLVIVKK